MHAPIQQYRRSLCIISVQLYTPYQISRETRRISRAIRPSVFETRRRKNWSTSSIDTEELKFRILPRTASRSKFIERFRSFYFNFGLNISKLSSGPLCKKLSFQLRCKRLKMMFIFQITFVIISNSKFRGSVDHLFVSSYKSPGSFYEEWGDRSEASNQMATKE